jgi:hypothetical protein
MRDTPSFLNTRGAAAPLSDWTTRGRNFAALASLPVHVLVRKKLGVRVVSLGSVGAVSAGLLGLQAFDNIHVNLGTFLGGGVVYDHHTAIRNLVFAFVPVTLFERFQRTHEEKHGLETQHSYSPGISRFGLDKFLPFSPKVIAVAIEPALGILTGAVCRRLGFSLLGWVIIASSVAFCLSQWQLYQNDKEHRRDRRDLGFEAQWESELMKQNAERKTRRDDSLASGLATGIDGLEGSIGQHRRPSDDEGADALAGGGL